MARNFQSVTPSQFNMPFLFWFFAKLHFGFRKPKLSVLGSQFAGVIEATGDAVTRFKPGDRVFGYLGQRMGAYAEYVCMSEEGMLANAPVNMTYEEAAAVPYGALMASKLLAKGRLQAGQKILIIGASGGIGAAAVQLAKSYGAEVTAVCSRPRMELVQALGADHVIDYTSEALDKYGAAYDFIFDILGKSSFSTCSRLLSPNGRYLLASFKLKQLMQMLWTKRSGKRVICALALENKEDLLNIKTLVENGKLRAVIDTRFPLEQAAAAHRYIEAGRSRGSVVLTVEGATSLL